MTDFKDLEIKTLAQFENWAKGATFTAIGATELGESAAGRSSVFARYRAQERAARAMWPTFRAAVIDAARASYPGATIAEIGDEIVIRLPEPPETVTGPLFGGLVSLDDPIKPVD